MSHRRTLTTHRRHYQLPARDSVFYAMDLMEMHPGDTTSVSTGACRRATLQMRFKPVSGVAVVEQLCLRGPPKPFVVALPRLNLYKWARAFLLFYSLSVPHFLSFPSLFLDLSPSARSRAAAIAACLSTRRPRGFNQG